jgi:hypothetical protein
MWRWLREGTYINDCLDHDSCVCFGHSLALGWCNDEFLTTIDDFAFAPSALLKRMIEVRGAFFLLSYPKVAIILKKTFSYFLLSYCSGVHVFMVMAWICGINSARQSLTSLCRFNKASPSNFTDTTISSSLAPPPQLPSELSLHKTNSACNSVKHWHRIGKAL